MLQDVKSYLGKCFAMKDLGDAAYILGIKIYRDRSKRLIGLCQSAYIEKILKRYSMENSKRGTIPMQEKLKLSKSQGASTPAEIQRMQKIPYASAVGSIMYAVRCTRPDVAFAQNMTSRFQQNPGEIHWTTVKNILKYLRNTKDMFLVYGGNMERELRVSCYTDAGYLTDADTLRSQTGYVFVLNGGVVDWKSTKQSIFATSSTDAEYIAAFDASKEAVWIRKFISGLGIVPTIEEPISMYCDNTGAIAIAKDHGITKGARHFRAKVHYLRETIEMGDVKIEKVDTEDNLADPFTKALAYPKHSELTKNIGLIPAIPRPVAIDIAITRKIVEPPYLGSVDWSKWLIFWLDERVVPLDHPDSNYKLAYDGFLSKVPIPESNIYPIKEGLSPEEAADEYEQRLKNLVANKTLKTSPVTGFAKFDLMLVGMGPDGHVASLFCWHFQRFEKTRWVTFITDSPKPPPPRITFTFPLINSASEIALVIVGEEKADAVKVALGEHADYGYPLPVQKVKPEGRLTWFLDNGATSLLK
ncbi:retrotransposon protein, putative, ty1-copia subclass [Tanacetum coccineum]